MIPYLDLKFSKVATGGPPFQLVTANPRRLWIAFYSVDGANYGITPYQGATPQEIFDVVLSNSNVKISCHNFPGLPQLEWWTFTNGAVAGIIEGLMTPQ